MSSNVLLSVENCITQNGLATIIANEISGSNIFFIEKHSICNSIDLDFYDLVIIEVRKNNKTDYNIIDNLINNFKNINFCLFTKNSLDTNILNLAQHFNINIIFANQPQKIIVSQILLNNLKFKGKRNSLKKSSKIETLDNILSNREFEIGLMLINGETISSISKKKNIALSTVSTYKKRIFDKTKVSNIIEMSKLFEMKDNWISRLVYENEASNDGGLKSMLKIIEYYKQNYTIVNIRKYVQNYYPRTDCESLVRIADENNLLSKIINKPSINFLIENNQPFIFKCKGLQNTYRFLICFSYSSEDGFFIWDYRNGKYFANIKGFVDMWDGNDCLFFLS